MGQYNAMAEAQGHRCALCGEKPNSGRRMHVDHDHESGRIRALLCHHCNLLLGNAKDSTARLRQAIAYLEKHDRAQSRAEYPWLADRTEHRKPRVVAREALLIRRPSPTPTPRRRATR